MWLMSLAWRALSVSWLVLLIAVRDSGVSLGASWQACRLEVVSEGLLQVALDRGSGWPAGRRFPESCPRRMVWRPPCTESAELSRMASAPHDGGQGCHCWRVFWGEVTRAWRDGSGVLGPGAVLLYE